MQGQSSSRDEDTSLDLLERPLLCCTLVNCISYLLWGSRCIERISTGDKDLPDTR